MENDNSMSERILRSLETIFKNDPELKDFTIIPTGGNNKNKSPVLYYEDHSVGLEYWCVKYIYKYAYTELFEINRLLRKKKLSYCKERDLNYLLIGALLVNPDVSTFWNIKRELVCNNINPIETELSFTTVVLSHKSKSNEAFAYRRWLLKRLLVKIPESDVVTPFNLLVNELNVCEMAAGKSKNNYHAWTHRIWCMDNMVERTANSGEVIKEEIDVNRRWLHSHVSEHTCYHYRQYLFNFVLKSEISCIYEEFYREVVRNLGLVNENDPVDILVYLMKKSKKNRSVEESNKLVNYLCLLLYDWFDTIESINSTFPHHESLWYFRRYLVFHLLKTLHIYHELPFRRNVKIEDGWNCYSSEGEKQPKMFKSQPNKVEASILYQILIKGEKEFIKKNMTNVDSFFEGGLSKRHEKWLKHVLCIDQL